MATPELRDVRARITVETDISLDIVSRVTGREKSEVIREILAKWASEQTMIATLLNAAINGQGIDGGISRNTLPPRKT